MYVQLKKVVIIFIFLLSIIIMLVYQNNSLKEGSYNILLISDKEDIIAEGLTKTVWEDITNLYSTSTVVKQSKDINYKYLEVKSGETFKSALENNILQNDLVIIIGNIYNDELLDVTSKYQDTNFLLIENDIEISKDNVYKINVKWDDIYLAIKDFLSEQINILREDKTLKKDEKLKIWCLIDKDRAKYNELKEYLASLDVELIYVDMKDLTVDQVVQKYNTSTSFYIINLNYDKQIENIKQLVKIQKQNVYDYYQQVTTKTPVVYSANSDSSKDATTGESSKDLTDQDDDSKNDENNDLKYIPIHYIGLYDGDISIGEYDNLLESGKIIPENILDFKIKIDYKDYLDKIIFDANAKHDYTLNIKNDTLKIKRI